MLVIIIFNFKNYICTNLITMKHQSFVFLLLVLFALPTYAGWQRSVTNYPRREYHSGNQNWMIAQHENGWMYFANNKGLLEYDGVEWHTYSIHNAKARAVKIGSDGRIYIGGMGQFGYFMPDRREGMKYVCLSDSLDKDTDIGVIWNVHIVGDRVYYQSDWRIFYLEDGRVKSILSKAEIKRSAVIHNKFYIASGAGLSVLNGDELSVLVNTEILSPYKVAEMLPSQDKILVVTSRNGLFVYDGSTLTPYRSAADSFIRDNLLFCAAVKDSILALGSVHDGVMLLNMQTNEIEKISTSNGLQNKTVLGMSFDRDNNLWLGLDNGIDCLHLNAPLFALYGNKLVIGSGYASSCYKNDLYLGTNQGLYCTEIPKKLNESIRMKFVPMTEGQVWDMDEYDDKLFVGADNGVFVVDGNALYRIKDTRGVWKVVQFGHKPDLLLAGSYNGFYLLHKVKGEWQLLTRVKGFTHSCKTMFVEGSNVIWVANKGKGLFRLTLSDDLTEVIKTTNYNNETLSPNNDVYVDKIDDDIVIASQEGIFRYDQIRDEMERFTSLENQLDGRVAYTYISKDPAGHIWYVTNGMLKILRYDPVHKNYYKDPNEIYLRGSLIECFESIYACDKSRYIIGTEEGFSLLDLSQKPHSQHLNLQIRRVYLTGVRDSLIYNRTLQGVDETLIIPYESNSLRIEYSVNNYDKSSVIYYSYQLVGAKDEEWSAYSENTIKEYTELKEGKYKFNVKIVTDKGEAPVIASIAFEVLPPWYRSIWAYICYVLLGGSGIYYLYIRLEASRKRLLQQKEEEFLKQKRAFQKDSQKKDEVINTLKEEHLQSELRHQSEELIRMSLNMVRKNEMLQDIKKEALGISHAISEENLVAIRRKNLRMINHIDNSIEHDDDLQAFQTTFDVVHHDFFKRLDEQFPELNNREKLMCAYIKINLMSKEIAPLLNISVRGVEISRYRLRKKLGLTEKDSLTEFLQRLSK